MKLKFFPKYTEIGPSSRYRIYRYLPYFNDFDLELFTFFDADYIPGSFKNLKGIKYIFKCYLRRFLDILRLNKDDLIFVQYEFTQFLPFNVLYFRWKKIKYIVDFDDAVFHDYDQHNNKVIRLLFKNKIPRVIKHANAVITGSPYLTDFAKKYNDNVYEIPTSLDITKYDFEINKRESNKLIIGWIGSSTTSLHLRLIVEPLKKLLSKNISFELRLIGYDEHEGVDFKDLPVKYIQWDSRTEAEELSKFDLGIMPLIDFPFARGKCAFKLIQYMACGIPTISTPFEANKKVDNQAGNLFASNSEEWQECFLNVKNNYNYFKEIGNKNKTIIKNKYSIQNNHKVYLKLLEDLKNGS